MNKYISFLLISMMINPTALHAAGRIQDSDVKSLTDVGGTVNVSRLINASKIYDATNNQQLSLSIANGALGGGSGGAVGTYSNFLNTKNPDAEKGTTLNWTNTGGALSVINTGQADGVYSFQFVASATAQKATSFLGLIPALSYSKNGLVRFTYSTTNSDFILQVTDGTNVLGQVILPAASTYQYGLVTLVLPSSGSIQVNIISQSAGTINFDDLYVGENFQAGITSTTATPTIQKFLSGSGTYTPTSSAVSYIRVRMVGGGGGGAGGTSTAAGVGGSSASGGGTAFGSSLLIANGGGGALPNGGANAGAVGGVGSIGASAAGTVITGGGGGAASRSTAGGTYNASGIGGSSALGGAGYAGSVNGPGGNAAPNSGSGGGGGGGIDSVASNYGAGGGSGAFVDAIISTPLAPSYTFTVGAGASGGTPTGGGSGGSGASGYIEVTEFYTPSTNQLYLASSGGLNPGDRVEGFYTSCPVGTIKADGSAISRTTYASLFAAISTTYGTGDGTTTFNLPNAQGVFTRGAGSQTIGGIAYTGTQGTTQGDQFQGHIHQIQFASVSGGAGIALTSNGTIVGANASMSGPVSDNTNGTPRTGAETRPANITDLVCIRTLPASPAPVIVGAEIVNCSYGSAAATSIPYNITVASIPFGTKEYDTHNAFSGGVFTAPVSGKYRVTAAITLASTTASSPFAIIIAAYKNGSYYRRLGLFSSTSTDIHAASGATTLQLNAGETTSIAVYQNVSSAGTTMTGAASDNWITIERVGN